MLVEDKFIATLLDDIRHKRLELPTLPEVAIKVRKLAGNPKVTVAQLERIIGTDPGVTARLLQIANSPLYRTRFPIENLHTAITRLGITLVRNLVTSLVMGQIFEAPRPAAVKKRLRAVWQHTVQVAAVSHVFAQRFTHLPPDQAMLAGLIHDIGKLPILSRIDTFPELAKDEQRLDRLVGDLHAQVGKLILETWHFPETLVAVAAEHEDLARHPDATQPDIVDVVLVANLHCHPTHQHFESMEKWPEIPALKRLGLTPETSLAALHDAQDELDGVRQLLTG